MRKYPSFPPSPIADNQLPMTTTGWVITNLKPMLESCKFLQKSMRILLEFCTNSPSPAAGVQYQTLPNSHPARYLGS
jgi:hypothetical protein